MDTLDYSERKDLKPALLIINPVSGKRMVLRNVAQIIRVLMDAGYKVTTMITGKKACKVPKCFAVVFRHRA